MLGAIVGAPPPPGSIRQQQQQQQQTKKKQLTAATATALTPQAPRLCVRQRPGTSRILSLASAAANMSSSPDSAQPDQAAGSSSSKVEATTTPVEGSTEPSANPGQRYASLHDFCMGIPYAMVCGVAALLISGQGKWLMVTLVSVVGVSSAQSLKTWKSGGSSAPFTALSTIAAAISGYIAARMLAIGVSSIASGIVLVLSLAFAAFGVSNLLSGGNPPPTSSKDKDK